MVLYSFLGRQSFGPARGSGHYIRKLARQLHRAGHRIVLVPEDDYTPSQLAVLNAIADEAEAEMRELCAPEAA